MVWVELAYYTSRLGGYMQHPTQQHMDAATWCMGYLFHHPEKSITYGGKLKILYGLSAMPEHFVESRGLYSPADSSWNTQTRPHGGHAVFRMNGAIHCSAKALKVITDSTAHAETAEASRATKSTSFFRMALQGVGRPVVGPTCILGDNKATSELVTKEGTSSKSRHFERATIFVKWAVMKLMIAYQLVSTKFMVADIFTKATDEATFLKMRSIMRNVPLPGSATVGEKAERIVRYLMNALRR